MGEKKEKKKRAFDPVLNINADDLIQFPQAIIETGKRWQLNRHLVELSRVLSSEI